jgi:fructokinase
MLGIDLGGTKIEAALLHPDGREQWRLRVPTPAGHYPGTLQALAALVQQARAIGGDCSIGMGTPGSVGAGGRMKNCNSTCLNGQALQADLQTLLGQAVHLANDANCLALSEATDGAGAGAQVVFAVILGTGAGGGVAVHGRVLHGVQGLAGEWGHNPLPWRAVADGPALACYCGQQGCIEVHVSGTGLARQHALFTGQALRGEAIVEAAAAGNAACRASLQRHTEQLARSLASVINLLDPCVIVLGGGLSRLPHLYTDLPALWGGWVFSAGTAEPVRTRLLPARHGDASGVRGAAWLGRQAG